MWVDDDDDDQDTAAVCIAEGWLGSHVAPLLDGPREFYTDGLCSSLYRARLLSPSEVEVDEGSLESTGKAREIVGEEGGAPGCVALKVVRGQAQPHDVRREVALLDRLRHPNVVPLLNATYSPPAYTLHLPFYPLSLPSLLSSPFFTPARLGPVFLVLFKSISFQILLALEYLHAQGVAHRDVKPENVLLGADGGVRLIDFGTAWEVGVEAEGEGERMCSDVGTGPYRPPELLYSPPTYDPFALDMWSLGATLTSFFTPLRRVRVERRRDPFARRWDEDSDAGLEEEDDADMCFRTTMVADVDEEDILGTDNQRSLVSQAVHDEADRQPVATAFDTVSATDPSDTRDNSEDDPALSVQPHETEIERFQVWPSEEELDEVQREEWVRESLFDASRGDIAYAWSIYTILGTPSVELWPEAKSFPSFTKIQFNVVPPAPLSPLLPNLPPLPLPLPGPAKSSSSSATHQIENPSEQLSAVGKDDKSDKAHSTDLDHLSLPSFFPLSLLTSLLKYSATQRPKASDALRHPFFSAMMAQRDEKAGDADHESHVEERRIPVVPVLLPPRVLAVLDEGRRKTWDVAAEWEWECTWHSDSDWNAARVQVNRQCIADLLRPLGLGRALARMEAWRADDSWRHAGDGTGTEEPF